MPLQSMYGTAALRAYGRFKGFADFSASAAPTNVGSSGGTSSTQTTAASTASFVGGSGSVTYLWQYVSGDASISALTGTAATCAFRSTGMAASEYRAAVWRCRVTDTMTGQQRFTNNVNVATNRGADPPPINCDLSPNGDTQSRVGAGDVSFAFNGIADHTYDFSNFGIGGTVTVDLQTSNTVHFRVTLTGAPQTISGTINFSVVDSATGMSGVSATFAWHAVST